MAKWPHCEKAKKKQQIIFSPGEEKNGKSGENPKMFFYQFLFNDKIMTMLEEICPYFSGKYSCYFSQGILFYVCNFTNTKKKGTQETKEPNVPSDGSPRPLFISREHEVLLLQGIFYCSSGQMGLSGVIFVKEKQRKSAKKTTKTCEKKANENLRIFYKSEGNPTSPI